jgi:prephenate dehydrogenase
MTGPSEPGETSFSEPRLAQARIAILGLGLMGGSLALALRGKCAQILGIEKDPGRLVYASALGLADRLSTEPGELLPQADLVVLAVPVRVILRFLETLPALLPGRAVVLDLGSTKSAITEAMKRLPARFDPVGGHPMCGKERSSLELAEASLYQDAPFALAELPQTTDYARRLVEELVCAVGARPVWLEAETHDRLVAATSHLPYLLASALAAATPLEAAPLAGPGYRSTSRLAVSPVDMMMDVLATNSTPVLEALQRLQEQLAHLQSCLAKGDDVALRERLVEAAQKQEQLLASIQKA